MRASSLAKATAATLRPVRVAPLPLDPALAEVIFEWRRKTEFSADSRFVFASPFMAGEKPYTPWNLQHNHLSPKAVKAGLGPISWHTLRHTHRARLGDKGKPLTVQKELMRHASIQTTLNTHGGGMMESIGVAHGRVVKNAMPRQWTSVDVSELLKCLNINKIMAERVGFSQAVCYSLRAFNKMPETIVLTDSYLVSRQEHASHKKH
jgi:hypothetical protein